MSDDSQFINVVFDPTFQNFEHELQTMSLEKMMSIQYSEEVLQKNFTVIITILKQLHRGQLDLAVGIKDNKDWIQKLREVTNIKGLEDKLDGFDEKLEGKNKELQDQIDALRAKQSQHDKKFLVVDDSFKDHGEQIADLQNKLNQLREEINNNNGQQESLMERMKQMETTPQGPDNSQDIKNIISELDGLRDRLARLETRKPTVIQPVNTNSTDGPVVSQGYDSDQLDEIYRRLEKHDADLLQLTNDMAVVHPLVKKHEDEDLPRLQEEIDALKRKLMDYQPSEGGSSEDMQSLLEQLKKLQSQVDQVQMTMSLMGGGGNSEEMGENQMQIILTEINKLRIQLDKYATTQDLDKEVGKLNTRCKGINDHLNEEVDKIRREFNTKLNQKLDVAEAVRMVNELNHLKELLDQLQKRGNSNQQVQVVQNTGPDSTTIQRFKDLENQINQVENEVKNHRLTTNQFFKDTTNKIGEQDKKIQGLQIDRIFSELQQLREVTDNLKKDADTNNKKMKDIMKQVQGFIPREEVHILLEERLKALRDELMNQAKSLEEKLKGKIDNEDLSRVEQNLSSKLEEVVQALIKQLANKQETKKALIYLEQKINQIFVILEGESGQKDGDGLFTKKPLLWSCASCDKDLDKFKGNLGDYRGWAVFPPKETSPERMGRFGVGYKNMQEKVRVNRDKIDKERDRYENQSTNMQRPGTQSQVGFGSGSQGNIGDQLPRINQR